MDMTNAVSIEKSKIEETEINATSQTSEYKEPSKKKIIFTMVLSFIVPAIIMALAFLKVRVYPGGKFTVLIYDMQAQFMPICASLRYLGHSQHSLLYSFYGALGNNALLNYKTYFANPLFWLTTLFPLEKLPDVLYFITIFFIGLCGLSFCTFLLYGSKSNRLRRYPFFAMILSCCYALMSFNIAYSMCINWLLEVALLPIMLIGIEHIIEGKKGAVYLLAMTYAVYNSDQLFYMSGIFCVLYLIYRLCEVNENRVRICVRFIICSGLACGLSMPILLPMVCNIMGGRMQTLNSMSGKWIYYPIWKPFKQLLSCQYDSVTEVGLPNIFCGTFIPILATIGVIKSNKDKKSIIISVCIILFYFASFSIVVLNQFWHGFNEPNGFPVRYSYTFCIFLLILSYDCISYFFVNKYIINKHTVILIESLAAIVAFVELYLNAGVIIANNNIFIGYRSNAEYQLQFAHVTDALSRIDDCGFYRTGRDNTYSHNDGMIYGYNGIEYFSSMYESNIMDFLGMLGYAQNGHIVKDYGGTPMTESLLGVKYKLMNVPEKNWGYESIYRNNSFELQYNKDALPLGYMTMLGENEEDIEGIQELLDEIANNNSFAVQELFISELTGKRVNAYEYIDYDIDEVSDDDYARSAILSFDAEDERPVWLYVRDKGDLKYSRQSKIDDGSSYTYLKVNGVLRMPFTDELSTMCVYLGTFKKGEHVEVEMAHIKEFDDPWLVYYNEAECKKALDNLRNNGLQIDSMKRGRISGQVSSSETESVLIMTLPYIRDSYMGGYNVLIDGKRCDYMSYRETLLAISVPEGVHNVEITFIPPGLVLGVVVGVISLLLFVLYLLLGSRLFKSFEVTEGVHEHETYKITRF